MSNRIHYISCPACAATNLSLALKAKDYTVSGEVFEIYECANCQLRFTQDVPDAAAIGPYYQSDSYISHTNTNKGLVNKLYHRVRSITLNQKAKLIEATSKKSTGTLLDIGSGTGAFAAHMKMKGWRVTGLEPDASARSIAAATNKIQLLESGELFQLPAGSFDIITMWHVLEHVHDLDAYLAQIKKLLAPGGWLLVAVPNYTSFDAGHYGEYWAAYDVPRHLYHFSPESMKELTKRFQMIVKDIKPMWFDSFYVSLLSEKYQFKKSSLLKGGWVGLLSNYHAFKKKNTCSSQIYLIQNH
ncbi:MAG: class I SAM-dependent methyltransferase [Chitinophagaceae bacterium]|nr:class I SAM-dependent methyltransferase [Chitinophagaceae bacterium]